MKRLLIGFVLMAGLSCFAKGNVSVASVTAQQRYPWNGLVDVVVTLECRSDDIGKVECSFAATNSSTGAAVPITCVSQNGADTGSSTTWTRRYMWTASNDVCNVKIDDLALTVDAKVVDGVQLWENGPYWAEYNVGASKPEEYGYYFWWGDTVGYKRNANNNGWISVKDGTAVSFSSGNCPAYGKSNAQLQSAGYTDSAGNLVAAHDAATVHLGAPWRMPTDAEFSALISNCDTTWTKCGGVTGRLVTGRGAYVTRSIFLPAAGYGDGSYIYGIGSNGNYWSSTPDSGDSLTSWYLYLLSDKFNQDYSRRRGYGRSVRPLRGFANVGTASALAGVTTHLKLDCRQGVRECRSTEGVVLRFDTSWYENGEEIRITDNGTVVTNGTAGCYTWRPGDDSSVPHLLQLEVLRAGEVIATETAQFALGYIRNVTARQLWPHEKVEVCYTLAGDICDVVKERDKFVLLLVDSFGSESIAKTVVGDTSCTVGRHRVVWDAEADGVAHLEGLSAQIGFGDELQWKGIVHRWSFNDNLNDSIGGTAAIAVGNVSMDGMFYSTHNGNSGTSYIDLGDWILPTNGFPITIEMWVRQDETVPSARILSFGSMPEGSSFTVKDTSKSAQDSITMTWSGIVEVRANPTVYMNLKPLDVGLEYHIAMVLEPNVDTSWTVSGYYHNAETGELLSSGSFNTRKGWTISDVKQTDMVLAQALTTWDRCAANSYNEVRIWNRALTESDFQNNVIAGSDAALMRVSSDLVNVKFGGMLAEVQS